MSTLSLCHFELYKAKQSLVFSNLFEIVSTLSLCHFELYKAKQSIVFSNFLGISSQITLSQSQAKCYILVSCWKIELNINIKINAQNIEQCIDQGFLILFSFMSFYNHPTNKRPLFWRSSTIDCKIYKSEIFRFLLQILHNYDISHIPLSNIVSESPMLLSIPIGAFEVKWRRLSLFL